MRARNSVQKTVAEVPNADFPTLFSKQIAHQLTLCEPYKLYSQLKDYVQFIILLKRLSTGSKQQTGVDRQ